MKAALAGHSSPVSGCAISGDGNQAVSASSGRTIKVWDLEAGKCLAALVVDGPLNDCAMSPDGGRIVDAGARGVYFLRVVI